MKTTLKKLVVALLLGMVTMGVALLWVVPYMETAHATFYERRKAIETA